MPVCGKAGILSRALRSARRRGCLAADVKLRADVTGRSGAMHAGGGIWSNHETRSRRSRIDGPDLGQCNRNDDHRKMTDAMGNLMDLRPSFLKGRSSSGTTSRNVLQALWQAAGMPDEALAQVSLTGADPVLPSSFAVGQAAQTSMAAAALAAAEIWHLRGGARQQVSVDMLHAAQECRSYFRINGVTLDPFDPITGAYRCGDGGWVRIHANFPTTATARLPCWAARRAKARPARPSSGRWRAGPPSTSNRPPPTPAWWSPPCAASMNGIIIRKGRPLPRSRCSRWNASARPIRVPAQVWSGSAPAHGHPRARPDPHHRRPGLRPRAGRLWRRRDAGEFPESAEHRQHHRHQPGQAVRVRRPGHGRWPHRTGQPAAQRARVRAGLPARRHGGAGLRPAGRGAHPAGHRLCVAVGLWRARPLGQAPGL